MRKYLEGQQANIDAALKALGIDNFLLGIQDAAFPALPEEDIGRGSPYSDGAAAFLEFVRSLGFNGIQLGPQGITSRTNSSPYDGTLFSRNPLSLAPLRLRRFCPDLLPQEKLANLINRIHADPGRVERKTAAHSIQTITGTVCRRFRLIGQKRRARNHLMDSYAAFRRHNRAWLERDGLYQALKEHYGRNNWKKWTGNSRARLDRTLFAAPPKGGVPAQKRIRELFILHGDAIEDYCFIQYLLAVQHGQLRSHCGWLGLELYGDCQIGLSSRDAWYAQGFLLDGYLMGAPPSRTNPEGQPWNYPVFDPRRYYIDTSDGTRQPGPVIRFLRERVAKLFTEFDGLRIDHPHGLVCPWVYRAAERDRGRAVRTGARLFASPDLDDHPALAEFAIVRPEQINRQSERYVDNWVTDLDPEQVHRYAALFEVIIEEARQRPNPAEIACEILSTQPYPIRQVMKLYGLGRFRVTQKADLANPDDVYRSENAAPRDWLMLGNHDTPSIWQLAGKMLESRDARKQADYLAERLAIPAEERPAWIRALLTDSGALAQAKFADLFVGPGRNIMVFFTDLLGIEEVYNRPGTVNAENWSLRIDPDYRRIYTARLEKNRALNIPKALAMALRARGPACRDRHRHLIAELENNSSSR
ncbi:MAG: 4-alpha-glucanotransferase [Desulfurivibrionaceae bacterium]